MSSASGSAGGDITTPRDWLLEQIEDRTSPDDPWTSEGQLRQHIQKNSVNVPFGTDAVEPAARGLEDEGEFVRWHGLLILAEEERLQVAIEHEADGDITRQILIGKLNGALQAEGMIARHTLFYHRGAGEASG